MSTSNLKYERQKVYLELLRIISCALVIFNHMDGYKLYRVSTGGIQFFYMCLTMITRLNVPVFFMISGALLLPKEEDVKTVIKKRVLRVLLVLLVFEAIFVLSYYGHAYICNEEYACTFTKFIRKFLINDFSSVYWYMYSYLGLLVVLPFFQRIAKGFNGSEFWLLMGLHFFTSSMLPLANVFLSYTGRELVGLSGDFQVPFAFVNVFFYPLIGYYIEYNLDVHELKSKHIIGLILLCITGIVLSNICTYYDAAINGEYSQNYVQLFDYLTAIVTFILVKYIFTVVKPSLNEGKTAKFITYMGAMTLGIYMLDPIFRYMLFNQYEAFMEPMCSTLGVSIGWIIVSMFLGTLVTTIMKQVPGLNKII